MTNKPSSIALLAFILCAFAPSNVAAVTPSETIAVERAAPTRAPAIRLVERPSGPPQPPLPGYQQPAPPPPQKFEKMSPSLQPAKPGSPMKAAPLCTGGKVLVGGNCVCPEGTVVLQGRCVPRLMR